MNKILVGLIVGAVLGVVDGATAWFTPAVRNEMLGIIIGSTFKGVIAGIAAGWFARRVQSVVKGIAFGFAVGLVLAFAVAAMPSATGEHYWWQIMVPGSILGGVIGWATQRYGRPGPAGRSMAAAALLIVSLLNATAHGEERQAAAGTPPHPGFEKLKSLAGTWEATTRKPDGDRTTVRYEVTANGSVVMETMFAGSPHEMINMYTVDGDSILATHYCSEANQPTLRLDRTKSDDARLVFDFVRVTGRDTTYINGVSISFEGARVVEEWSSSAGGDKMTLDLHNRR